MGEWFLVFCFCSWVVLGIDSEMVESRLDVRRYCLGVVAGLILDTRDYST